MIKNTLLICVLTALIAASCSSVKSNIKYDSTIKRHIESVVHCDNNKSKNFTINPDDLENSYGFFQGHNSDIFRIHYIKTSGWTGIFFKGSGITRDGTEYGYVDIERGQGTSLYWFKSQSNKMTNALTESPCYKLKKWNYFKNGKWYSID